MVYELVIKTKTGTQRVSCESKEHMMALFERTDLGGYKEIVSVEAKENGETKAIKL